MTDAPKLVFLGALDVDPDATIALDLHGTVEEIQAAIERANLERATAAKRESEALAKMFLDKKAPPK